MGYVCFESESESVSQAIFGIGLGCVLSRDKNFKQMKESQLKKVVCEWKIVLVRANSEQKRAFIRLFTEMHK